jgi:selenocysteine lyase/cysteine desulfurase
VARWPKRALSTIYVPASSPEDFRHCITGKSNGAVRVSLGLASNLADVEAFLAFLAELRER